MCTVTLVRPNPSKSPSAGLLMRMAANRDVQRSREAALLPQTRIYQNTRCVMPVDPISDGTWLAINEFGLVITLLNRTLPEPLKLESGQEQLSRGLIIPRLIHHQDASSAADQAMQLNPSRYPTFRLLMVDEQDLIELRSDGKEMSRLDHGHEAIPFMITSSGLGDHLVERPRRELFESEFKAEAEASLLPIQDKFHHHLWPDQTPLSVNMSRDDARTVSYTLIDRYADHMIMQYHGEAPGMDGPQATVTLPLTWTANA